MVVRCSVHLHGEASTGMVTRCSVHEPLTYENLRAVYPFAGRFHFRVKRRLEGGEVWYDVRAGEAIHLDDPHACDVRALCVDYDDDRWDGPAARGAADDDDDPLVAAARDSVDAVRRAARAAAASDAGRRATAAVSSAASAMLLAMRARAGKLSSWLAAGDTDPSEY